MPGCTIQTCGLAALNSESHYSCGSSQTSWHQKEQGLYTHTHTRRSCTDPTVVIESQTCSVQHTACILYILYIYIIYTPKTVIQVQKHIQVLCVHVCVCVYLLLNTTTVREKCTR